MLEAERGSPLDLATEVEVDETPVEDDSTGETLALAPAPPSRGPDPVGQAVFDAVVVEAMSKGSLKDKQVLLQAEAELDDFVASESSRHVLSPVLSSGTLNSYQRLLVHRLGDSYKVTRLVEGGRFFLQKNPSSQRPPNGLDALLDPVTSDAPDVGPALAPAHADAAGSSLPAEGYGAPRVTPDGLKFKIMSRTPSATSVPVYEGPDTPNKSVQSGPDPSVAAKLSFEERQAAYAQARERIFASQAMQNTGSADQGSTNRPDARSTSDADPRAAVRTDDPAIDALNARLRANATVFDPSASAHGYEDVAAFGLATAQAWPSERSGHLAFQSAPVGPMETAAWPGGPLGSVPVMSAMVGALPQTVVPNDNLVGWHLTEAFDPASCAPFVAAGPTPHLHGYVERGIPPWVGPPASAASFQPSGAHGPHGQLGPFTNGYADHWGARAAPSDVDFPTSSTHRFARPAYGLDPLTGGGSNAGVYAATTPHRPSSALSSSSGSSVVTASSTFSRGPPLPRHNQHHLRSLRQTSYPPPSRPVSSVSTKHTAHRAPQSASSASTSSQSRVTPPPSGAVSASPETRPRRPESNPGSVRHPLPLKPSWSVQPPS